MAKKKKGNELILKVKKEEFFNPLVLAPHSEINKNIYEAVDNYAFHLKKYENFKIIIFTNSSVNNIHEKFKELFYEHYTDECYKRKLRFISLFKKTLILIAVALIILITWISFKASIFRDLLATLWAFNVWEASHTMIEAIDVFRQYERISHIKNATIEFSEY